MSDGDDRLRRKGRTNGSVRTPVEDAGDVIPRNISVETPGEGSSKGQKEEVIVQTSRGNTYVVNGGGCYVWCSAIRSMWPSRLCDHQSRVEPGNPSQKMDHATAEPTPEAEDTVPNKVNF